MERIEITIKGNRGSGKTTIAELLHKYLCNEDFYCRYSIQKAVRHASDEQRLDAVRDNVCIIIEEENV